MVGYDKEEEEAKDRGDHYLSRVKNYKYEDLGEENWAEVVSTFRVKNFRDFGEMSPKDMEKLLRDHVCTAIGEKRGNGEKRNATNI